MEAFGYNLTMHAYCYPRNKPGFGVYCARILIKFAHISKNSMVWLPGLGVKSTGEESSEVTDEVREASAHFPWASASESLLWQDR